MATGGSQALRAILTSETLRFFDEKAMPMSVMGLIFSDSYAARSASVT